MTKETSVSYYFRYESNILSLKHFMGNMVNFRFAKDKWASGFTDLCFVDKVVFESRPVESPVSDDMIFNPS